MTDPIFHITTEAAWEAARAAGSYTADSLAAAGFIHCSRAGQVVRVANDFYAGRRDLVLLVIDPERLTSELRWEPGTDHAEELFPHVYGPIDLAAVVKALPFQPGADGRFSLPDSLTR